MSRPLRQSAFISRPAAPLPPRHPTRRRHPDASPSSRFVASTYDGRMNVVQSLDLDIIRGEFLPLWTFRVGQNNDAHDAGGI